MSSLNQKLDSDTTQSFLEIQTPLRILILISMSYLLRVYPEIAPLEITILIMRLLASITDRACINDNWNLDFDSYSSIQEYHSLDFESHDSGGSQTFGKKWRFGCEESKNKVLILSLD
jgi:hypothetical protein